MPSHRFPFTSTVGVENPPAVVLASDAVEVVTWLAVLTQDLNSSESMQLVIEESLMPASVTSALICVSVSPDVPSLGCFS